MEEASQIEAMGINAMGIKEKKKSKVKSPLAHFGQRTHTHSFTHLFKKC